MAVPRIRPSGVGEGEIDYCSGRYLDELRAAPLPTSQRANEQGEPSSDNIPYRIGQRRCPVCGRAKPEQWGDDEPCYGQWKNNTGEQDHPDRPFVLVQYVREFPAEAAQGPGHE